MAENWLLREKFCYVIFLSSWLSLILLLYYWMLNKLTILIFKASSFRTKFNFRVILKASLFIREFILLLIYRKL